MAELGKPVISAALLRELQKQVVHSEVPTVEVEKPKRTKKVTKVVS